MFRVALKNLFARKFRLVTTGLAILLGVAFMSGGFVLTDTLGKAFEELFGDLNVGTDAQIRTAEEITAGGGPGGGFGQRARFDDAALDDVAALDGVEHAVGSVVGFGFPILDDKGDTVGPEGGPGPPGVIGSWTDVEPLNPWQVDEGRGPEADDEVVVDRQSAEESDLEIGDQITILATEGPVSMEIVGIIRYGDLDTLAGSFASMTLPVTQRLVGEPGRLDSISVSAEDGFSQVELQAAIERVVPDGLEVVTGDELNEESSDDVSQQTGFISTIINVFAGIALFVGSFIIYNTFSIIVAQRTREMALLRAIGASRRQVLGSMLLEALAVGLVASLVGLGVGILIAIGLRGLLEAVGFELPNEGVVLQTRTIVVALVVGVVVTVVAATAPARRASRVSPLAALRDVASGQIGDSRLRLALGALVTVAGMGSLFAGLVGSGISLVAIGAALTFLGVAALGPVFARPITGALGRPLPRLRGITGQLARENAMRNPKRTARTAAALLIGVALVGTITIVAASVKASFTDIFDDQFTGDLVIEAGGFGGGGVSSSLADELRADPTIGALAEQRNAPVVFDGDDDFLAAISADGLTALVDLGDVDGDIDDLDETGLAVHQDLAEEEGWEVGTVVPVHFPTTGDKELTVRLVYENDELAGSHFVGIPVFDANVPDTRDSAIYIKVAEGVSLPEARVVVEDALESYPTVEVQDREEYAAGQSAFIDTFVNVIYAFLGLSVVIAMFGIANTLALSVVERTRELGLLRAVGMTRSQLRATVRWEAVLIALFGTLGGLLVGTFFGWSVVYALREEGFRLFRVPVFRMGLIASLAAVFGVLAAYLPARRAARLDILRAVSTE